MIFARIFAVLRLVAVFIITFVFLLLVLFLRLIGVFNTKRGLSIRRVWANAFCKTLGFHTRFEGDYPRDETLLFISNHRSSLDPLVILQRVKAFPVSRFDVGNWPLVGLGGRLTGMILVDKSSRESRRRTKDRLFEEMQNGNSILIFPEGHTYVGEHTDTFQIGSFEQASKGGFRVQPMVFEYKYKADYWDHSDNFAMHFIKRFGKWRTPIVVRFGPPIAADNKWTLLREAQAWINANITDVRSRWDG